MTDVVLPSLDIESPFTAEDTNSRINININMADSENVATDETCLIEQDNKSTASTDEGDGNRGNKWAKAVVCATVPPLVTLAFASSAGLPMLGAGCVVALGGLKSILNLVTTGAVRECAPGLSEETEVTPFKRTMQTIDKMISEDVFFIGTMMYFNQFTIPFVLHSLTKGTCTVCMSD